MKYTIPQSLLDYFESEAVRNLDKDGQIETLALGIGKLLDNDCIQVEELILPNQEASTTHVEDTGIEGQPSTLWIQSNSKCFRNNPSKFVKKFINNYFPLSFCNVILGKAIVALWLHSHVAGNECGFSSVDLHTQSAFELIIPNIIGGVVEIKNNKVVKYDFYQLSVEGKEKVKTCKEKLSLHSSCSNSAFYKSVKKNVSILQITDYQLHIFDARNDEDIDLQILPLNNEVKVKCNHCCNFSPVSSILKHIAKNRKCSHHLKSNTIEHIRHISKGQILKKQRERNLKKVDRKEYDAARHEKNKTIPEKKAAKRAYEMSRVKEIKTAKKANYQKMKQKEKNDCENHRALFEKEITWGPIFPCVSCNRDMFSRGVKHMDADLLSFLKSENLIKFVDLSKNVDGSHYICHNCKTHLLKKKMPPLCFMNGLKVSTIPDCLKSLKGLEKQLIKKNLPFLKVRQLPKTRMDILNDKIVNVPITDDDVIKNVTCLPRTKDKSGTINIKWKRRLKYKTYYKMQKVRPYETYQGLKYLTENNPFYKDVHLLPYEEFVKDCHSSSEEEDENEETSGKVVLCHHSESSDESSEDDSQKKVPDETDTVYNNVTCLVPEDMSTEVIVNNTEKTMKKKMSRNSATIYEIAPGENKVPNNWSMEKNHEEMAFPNLFPNGENGFDQEREIELSPSQYFCQRAMDDSGIFEEEEDYIFCAEQKCTILALQRQIDVSLKMGKVVKSKDGTNVMKGGDAFSIFKNIPDTPSYWKAFRNEIFARMEQYGPFQMFFTLSCAEARWDNVVASVLKKEGHDVQLQENTYLVGGIPLAEHKEKNIRSMTELLKKHYLLITRMFDDKIKSFIKNILMKHKVAYYSYRIEFQARGMPHVHGVFWLPKEETEKYMNEGIFDKAKIPKLIDQWISCSLENEDDNLNELIRNVNVHKHTKSCKKYRTNCRFNFPKLPSDETLIASPLPEDFSDQDREKALSEAKQLLDKVKKFLEDLKYEDCSLSLIEMLDELSIDYEDYKNALRISQKGDVVILKRTINERHVNNYNPCFISAIQANMDLQFVSDLHAVVTYVTDYFSKNDDGMTKVLKLALKESTDCSDFQRLNLMKQTFFTHRQVNVAQAAYRLISGMNLKGSNVGTVFVSSGFPQNRFQRVYRVDKPRQNVDQEDDEEKDIENDDSPRETFAIEDRIGEFAKATTVHEKYSNRPMKLENMCLAQFATLYENSSLPKSFKFQDDCSTADGDLTLFGSDMKLPKYIILNNEKNSVMRLRLQPKVLRIHKSSKKKDYEEVYAELLLFYHWRDEQKDLHCDDAKKCIKLFNKVKSDINQNRKSIYPFTETIQEVCEYLESTEDHRPQHIGDSLNAAAEQENMDDMEEMEAMDESELPDVSNESKSKEKVIMKPIVVDSDDVMLDMTRKLAEDQMVVLGTMVDYCKRLIVAQKKTSIELNPPNIIAHGGAGVGKTFLNNITGKWVEKILRMPGDHPLKPKVLKMAFTGMASSLAEGTTVHTGLGFKFGSRKYLPLRESRLEYYRKIFEELEVIIIDEFSMISADMLYDINRRLQEIFISKDLFGGRSLVLIGDILQLPPVLARPIFSRPFSKNNQSLFNSSKNIWKNMSVVTLDSNKRQGVGRWTECLNRARIGKLSCEDKVLLEERRLSKHPEVNATEACHTFFTNKEANEYNEKMLNLLPTDMIHIESEGLYPRGYRLKVKEHGTIEDTSLRKHLFLKKGARIILNFNVNLSDSLVNGSLGTILDFVFEGQKVKAVIISFDNPVAGEQQRRDHENDCNSYSSQNGTPIYKISLEHALNQSNSGARGKTVQFPMRLAWGSTCHSLQGITIKKGSNLIAHGNKKMKLPKNMYYVMLSRVASLENLYLDEFVNLEDIVCDEKALKAKEELDEKSTALELDEVGLDIYYVNIRSLEKHAADLLCDVYAKRSACICLVETWVNPGELCPNPFRDKAFFEASHGRGKGSCAFVPKDACLLSTVHHNCYQLLSFLYNKKIEVTIVYLTHDEDLDLQMVVEELKKMFTDCNDKLILGDFNFEPKEKNVLTKFFQDRKLRQVVQEPTHVAGRTIDHIYLSEGLVDTLEFKVMFKYFSDHAAMQIKLNI